MPDTNDVLSTRRATCPNVISFICILCGLLPCLLDKRAYIAQSGITEMIRVFIEVRIVVDCYAPVTIEHTANEMSALAIGNNLKQCFEIEILALVVRKSI